MTCNVEGRDLASFDAELKRKLNIQLHLPGDMSLVLPTLALRYGRFERASTTVSAEA